MRWAFDIAVIFYVFYLCSQSVDLKNQLDTHDLLLMFYFQLHIDKTVLIFIFQKLIVETVTWLS